MLWAGTQATLFVHWHSTSKAVAVANQRLQQRAVKTRKELIKYWPIGQIILHDEKNIKHSCARL